MKPLHQIFFDLVFLASKSNSSNSLLTNSVNNSLNYSVNQSINSNFNSFSEGINHSYMLVEDFISMTINSIAYCICPGITVEGFNFSNPKSLIYYKKQRNHNHPESLELPPIDKDKKYSLVLDMDETLIHFFDVSYLLNFKKRLMPLMGFF